MPASSSVLMVHIQIALGVTQKELGAIIGKTKRTIQRWQSKGTQLLTDDEARLLADRLQPERPDLAAEVLALGHSYGLFGGMKATPEVLAAILAAAAAAGGTSSEGARPLVAAAFERAAEEGVTVGAVLMALRQA